MCETVNNKVKLFLTGVNMLSLDQLQERLKRSVVYRVAKRAGLNYQTVYRITRGELTNPRYTTMIKIEEVLAQMEEAGELSN